MCTGVHDFIPAPNVAKVTMTFQTYAGIAENIYHVKKGSAWDETTLTAIATLFDTLDAAYLKTVRNNGILLTGIKVVDLTTDHGLGIEVAIVPGRAGTGGGPGTPDVCTAAVKWVTGLVGRSYRGRTYLVGLVDSMLNTGSDTLTAAAVTAILTAYNHIITDCAANSTPLGVLSYCNNKVWRTEAVFTPITNVNMDNTIDVQRRRGAGRGI